MKQAPPIEVLFVVLPDTLMLDWAGPAEAFRIANRVCGSHDPQRFAMRFVGPRANATSSVGVERGDRYRPAVPAREMADAVERALLAREGETPEPPEDPMSADRVRWEHIQRVFELCDRNVSETARRLNMHRRTLQRILAKRSPR